MDADGTYHCVNLELIAPAAHSCAKPSNFSTESYFEVDAAEGGFFPATLSQYGPRCYLSNVPTVLGLSAEDFLFYKTDTNEFVTLQFARNLADPNPNLENT